MDFTFVRAERTQQENQERAYIAASRRQDRGFPQRLESLRKASELHCARTGKRFEITESQIQNNGPIMELCENNNKLELRRDFPDVSHIPNRGAGQEHGTRIHEHTRYLPSNLFLLPNELTETSFQFAEDSQDKPSISSMENEIGNALYETPPGQAALFDFYFQTINEMHARNAGVVHEDSQSTFGDFQHWQEFNNPQFIEQLDMSRTLDAPHLTSNPESQEIVELHEQAMMWVNETRSIEEEFEPQRVNDVHYEHWGDMIGDFG